MIRFHHALESGEGSFRPKDGRGGPLQAGATGHRARVFGVDESFLWESASFDADTNTASIPFGTLGTGSFRWTVEVEGPVRRSRLGPFTFEVQPR